MRILLVWILLLSAANGKDVEDVSEVTFSVAPGTVHLPPLVVQFRGSEGGAVYGMGDWNFTPLSLAPDDEVQKLFLQFAAFNVPESFFKKETIEELGGNDTEDSISSWPERLVPFGIGAYGRDGEIYLCCSEKAVEQKACREYERNLLIVPTRYEKSGRVVNHENVLTTELHYQGGQVTDVSYYQECQSFDLYNTTYAMIVVANCGTGNTTVAIKGEIFWTSYAAPNILPMTLTTVSHAVIAVWYRVLMEKNVKSRIALEAYILAILVLAFVASAARVLTFLYEGTTTRLNTSLDLMVYVISIVKTVASRTLYIMVALGWGVTRPRLSPSTTLLISFLGVAWAVFYLADVLSNGEGMGLFWTARSVALLSFLWVLGALVYTMTSLSRNGQHRKLARFRWMLGVFFVAVALQAVRSPKLLLWYELRYCAADESMEIYSAENEVAYLVIVACLAYLWRPHPDAGEFGYSLLLDHDIEDVTAELELAETTETPNN